ncbi:hypothetical protein ABT294_06940 [Nonomuraea sp. NPDC000554]|uniref:hypothetical protein n=1 Tax=Nonomuraea sp. NPDC000554 TaxID=3154259 RepID=UPI0033258D88
MDKADENRQEMADVSAVRPPWAGIVVSVLCTIAMIAIAWAVWDSLPEIVTTRKATATRPGLDMPRLVVAGALPVTLVIIGAAVAGESVLLRRLRHRINPLLVASPRSRARSVNLLFVMLPLLFVVLQTGILLRTAGYDVPLEKAVAVGLGVLLIAVGNLLPKISPSRIPAGAAGHLVLAWQRSQRAGGLVMMLLGGACAVGAFFFPPLIVAVASAFAVTATYLLMALLTAMRMRP